MIDMKTIKKIWDIVSTVLVILVVLCAAFLMGTRLLGYDCYNVLTGSMAPKYNVGDLIYVKEVDFEEIQVGDAITFILNDELDVATHQVTRIDKENRCFYTKGLANKEEDGAPVHYENVLGEPKFCLPKLGYVADYVQNPPGLYVTIAIGAVLILLVFLPDLIVKRKRGL